MKHPWLHSSELKVHHRINRLNTAREMLYNVDNYRRDNIIKFMILAYLVHQNANISQSIEATKSNNESDLNKDGKIEAKELEYAHNIME